MKMKSKLELSIFQSQNETEYRKQKSSTSSVPYYKLYRYASNSDIICSIIGIICTIIVAICQPIYIIIYGVACGDFIKYENSVSEYNITDDEKFKYAEQLHNDIYNFGFKTALVGVLNLILQYLAGVLFSHSSLRQVFKIRKLYFEKTLNQDISWFDTHQTGDFTTTFSENLTKIEEGIGEKVSLCIFHLMVSISGISICFIMEWQLTLVCIILLPLSFLLTAGISLIAARFSKKEMESYGTAGAIAEEIFSTIRTVVAFDGQDKEVKRYNTFLEEAKQNNIRRNIFQGISEGMVYFFMYASCVLAALRSVSLIIEGRELNSNAEEFKPGVIIAIIYTTWNCYWNIYLAAPFIGIFGVACGAASKVFEILDHEPHINQSLKSGIIPEVFSGELIFENVHFKYPSRDDVKVLRGITLHIKAGETVAFVGSSGCGKSTCIHLLQRFYDANKGSILIDGKNIKDLNLKTWRSRIGVVGQEPVLFAASIEDNIRYGNMDATLDEIKMAAERAQAHTFIEKLPQAYNTIIGERGTQLSGGQKQRIAIARALIRKPALLLLDEATSALDTTSEAEVQAAIDRVSRECTTIIIAHRLSTVRSADRIIVFSKGKIVEQGSYNELYEKGGIFFDLVKAQNGENGHINNKDHNAKQELFQEVELNSQNNHQTKERQEELSKLDDHKTGSNHFIEVLKLNKPEWPWILLGTTCSTVIGASLPILLLLMAYIIGDFYIEDSGLLQTNTQNLCWYIIIVGIIAGCCYVLQYYAYGRAGESLTFRVRSKMFSSMLNQEIAWFDKQENAVGALCAKLSSDGAAIQNASGRALGLIMNSLATLLVSNILAFCFQWQLALVISTFLPAIIVAIYFETRILQGNATFRETILQKSAAVAVESINNIRTVASLGCENVFLERYLAELQPYIAVSKKQSHYRAIQLGLARVIFSYGYVVGLIYGARLITDSNLTFKTVLSVTDLQVQGSYAVGQAVAFLPNFQNGLEATKRIFAILKRIPMLKKSTETSPDELNIEKLRFDNIHFAYPSRPEISVLQGLNLNIPEGKTIALVGSSGCGKSTVIQLLERFYDPTSGDIYVNDRKIDTIEASKLRKNLGLVSQEPTLFDRSIAENISYGLNYEYVSMEKIIQAAREANIHDFIVSLPMGYETRLGSKGTQLSGGQKQRIAIARALIRNPKVLLLDEATSALDAESEQIVQEALDKAKNNRTCIIIAHRLTTIKDADLICVLKKGSIIEVGNHMELMAKQEHYYRFYRSQINT